MAGWKAPPWARLRTALLEQLRAADHYGCLRVYYPVVPELGEACINMYMYAKLLMVDDELVRVVRQSEQSLHELDSERDLAIGAHGEVRIAIPIAALRNRLVVEHLGVRLN